MATAAERVLVTGAAGCIGRLVCPFLEAHGYRLRTFDRNPAAGVREAVSGRLEDLAALRRAAAGMDVVVHLAARADEGDFVTDLVPSNVVGVHHVLEAARLEGVKRVILASSCQAADLLHRRRRIGVRARHPSGPYGLTKLWGEDLGRLHAREHGLRVLAARLGWVARDPEDLARLRSHPQGRSLFLSHDDVRAFFLRALRASLPPFAVVYAFSRQHPGERFDMEPARRLLGFEPADRFPEGLDFPSQPEAPP